MEAFSIPTPNQKRSLISLFVGSEKNIEFSSFFCLSGGYVPSNMNIKVVRIQEEFGHKFLGRVQIEFKIAFKRVHAQVQGTSSGQVSIRVNG